MRYEARREERANRLKRIWRRAIAQLIRQNAVLFPDNHCAVRLKAITDRDRFDLWLHRVGEML